MRAGGRRRRPLAPMGWLPGDEPRPVFELATARLRRQRLVRAFASAPVTCRYTGAERLMVRWLSFGSVPARCARHAGFARALAVLAGLAFVAACFAIWGQTTRASLSSTGSQGNGRSWSPSLSEDGRFVAFHSEASNLVSDDTNGARDVFVRDRATGTTTRVSVSQSVVQGNNESSDPSMSADGRFVAYGSLASNLVEGDTNAAWDVFVHDLASGQTTRVSLSSARDQGNNHSRYPSISANGRYVAFHSGASNLVPGDTNGAYDVFVHDRATGHTTRVSVSTSGVQGNASSWFPVISADGRFLAFHSEASNLVQGDTNGVADVFVHDRSTGETTCVSVNSFGEQGNVGGTYPSISGNGRYVAFGSGSSNLVQGDTNGLADAFVHDRWTGQTTRVSVGSFGEEGNRESWFPSINGDGRLVAFGSLASNFVPGDTNNTWDIFLRDRATGHTTRVSVNNGGGQAELASHGASIAANAHAVAFWSNSSNLVPGDTNGVSDVFVHRWRPDIGVALRP